MNSYYAAAERLGIDVRYDAEVVGARRSRRRVRRRRRCASDGAVRRRPRASAVVVAAGGFEANLEWLREAWGDAARQLHRSAARRTTRARCCGCCSTPAPQPVGDPRECHAVAVDGRAPKFDGGIVTRLDCVPLGIVVNAHGERFYDEGEDFWPKRYAIWGKLVARAARTRSPTRSSTRRCAAASCRRCIRRSKRASIRELAAQLEPAGRAARGDRRRVQRAVQPGAFDHTTLDDCRTDGLDAATKTHWAQRLDTPPFCGYPLRPGITFTYLGVRVDARRARAGCERRAVRERLRGRRDHGRQRAAEGLHRRHRHDDRHGVRPDCGRERGTTCKPSELTREGARVMSVCNACRYCEQYCPVFPAMEQRLTFATADLELSREPLPRLRRMPVRVPVRAAARVRDQRAADVRARCACSRTSSTRGPRRSARRFAAKASLTALLLAAVDDRAAARRDARAERRRRCSSPARRPTSTPSCRTASWSRCSAASALFVLARARDRRRALRARASGR